MKYDFIYHNPTKIYFGKTALSYLKEALQDYGQKILLVYGGGSVKRIGLYDEVKRILKECDKQVVELSGVMPNPTYEIMMEGVCLIRQEKIDFILALGGGSVIDCAKGMSVAAYAEEEPWETYWINKKEVTHPVVPLGTVLTMVGTGSEANGGSVITHEEKKLKVGRVFGPNVYPKFSILNPEYTYSVPKYQMVSGIFDIMSHLMEQYFSGTDDNTSDYLIEGLLKSLIVSTKKALANATDYEARSNLMWTATLALNTLVGCSKEQDWEVHMIEHQLGAYTDCAHGMGLAAISIPYYRHIYSYGLDKFVRFAKEVWGVSNDGKTKEQIALEGLDELKKFIVSSNMVTSLKELGATKEMLPLIANSTVLGGGYKKLSKEEILEILEECYE
ncbi:MAG TPA: iron-containing alcohol dehydrogenase [Candidatus Pelethenecus faecipullorum]|uniref:Iron-containing alcohol dehydrogenase n=1 Tax=Candidatus Pelethenecus faecipullorum TaxID=2840900 RepID=A0A9D1KIS5_9MOLU|nr:iron-containing alcohol dehydrogenase [Candidatus Pelethenecus faecipullorum]